MELWLLSHGDFRLAGEIEMRNQASDVLLENQLDLCGQEIGPCERERFSVTGVYVLGIARPINSLNELKVKGLGFWRAHEGLRGPKYIWADG